MSTSLISVDRRRTGLILRVAAYVELTKPKIAVLVLTTVAVAASVASWGQPDVIKLLNAVLGTGLVAASGSALNQWLERHRDTRMARTAGRPLPAGVLSSQQVLVFGWTTILMGTVYLGIFVNLATCLLALATWSIYVWLYTPLKSRTPMNTSVGAIAGAFPVWIGWASVEGQWDWRSAALYLVVFLWQFPHFMAIAWIYRHEYAQAGLRMWTVVDPSGLRAGFRAVSAALALIPVSFIPGVYNLPTAMPFMIVAFLLGIFQLICAILFFARRDEPSARQLLRASLVYLPTLLVLTLIIPLL